MRISYGVPSFVYVTRQETKAVNRLKTEPFPFNVWIIAPDHDRVGLGALDIAGWQFFLCSDAEILEAVSLGLPAYLDSRMRKFLR